MADVLTADDARMLANEAHKPLSADSVRHLIRRAARRGLRRYTCRAAELLDDVRAGLARDGFKVLDFGNEVDITWY